MRLDWRCYEHRMCETPHQSDVQNRLLRSVTLCVVLLMHFALAIIILDSERTSPEGHVRSALKVRFINIPKAPIASADAVLTPVRPTTSRTPVRLRPSAPQQAAEARESIAPPAPERSLDITAAAIQAPLAYVPGGRLQKEVDETRQARLRLPGERKLDGSPSFEMVDPKAHGFATIIIRAIGGITGAEDPECVNLDAWQGMTQEERIEHHISDADLEKVKQNYRCYSPRRAPLGRR
jgi:hypothetical protein